MDFCLEPGCRMSVSVLPAVRYFGCAKNVKPTAELSWSCFALKGVVDLGGRYCALGQDFGSIPSTSERAATHMAGQLRFDLSIAT